MLKSPKPFRDPLGNTVQIPLIMSNCGHDYDEISQVVVAPAFIIQVKPGKLYFFRLINFETNMVVEACRWQNQFVVCKWIENPTAEYISVLLQKGSLISFR